MAGRKPGFKHTAIARERINVGMILQKVQRYLQAEQIEVMDNKGRLSHYRYMLDGKDVTMTKDQLAAANLLLSKSLPSLSSTELSGEVTNTQLYVPVSDRLPDPRVVESNKPTIN